MRHLAKLVLDQWPLGTDLVLGDGGFPEARNLHDQEAAMSRLVTSQMAAAALLLKDGGVWICKVGAQ